MKRQMIAGLFLLLAASALPLAAQESTMTREQRQMANMKLMPFMFKHFPAMYGSGMTLGNYYVEYGDDPAFQELTGTTDEQYSTFSDSMLQMRENLRTVFDPILASAGAENDPVKLEALADEMSVKLTGALMQATTQLQEIVTPEQANRIRELNFQTTSRMVEMGFPLVNYDAYQALNLNAHQKEELEKIRKDFAEEQTAFFAEWTKMFPAPGQRPTQEQLEGLEKKLKDQAEEGKKLTARIQSKIVTILDKDQEKKLVALKTNIPAFVKERQKKMGMPSPKVDEKAYETWQDSWKPGQPIPPEFREREKSRRRPFPMM